MGNDANRATVRAAFRAWQDGTGAITSLLAVRSPVRRRQAPARPRPSRDLSSYPPRY
jgi:hypothetical protein